MDFILDAAQVIPAAFLAPQMQLSSYSAPDLHWFCSLCKSSGLPPKQALPQGGEAKYAITQQTHAITITPASRNKEQHFPNQLFLLSPHQIHVWLP